MLDLNNISRIYFIGIGGIGMSAIARYFNSKGMYVSGYDKTLTSLTKQMENEGIAIHYEDSIELLDKDAGLVVYTPAVPQDHQEFKFYRQNNYTVMKRSGVLEAITAATFNICIAGTHGKTTISTMIAHILRDSSYGCTAFLGGIAVNYNTNYWSGDNKVCVVEADEYDRSFLKLQPDIAIISAMDADHLDIYGTEENMQEAFIEFSALVKSKGLLITKFGLKRNADMKASQQLTYSLQNDSADAYAANVKMVHGGYHFSVLSKSWMIDDILLNMGGMHNVENAVAAIIVAQRLNIGNSKIRAALKSFKGVKRRFEYVLPPLQEGEKGGDKEIVFIDDYAHHPEELKALISSAKSLFSGMKCTIVFQPHLYSRTRDLAPAFAKSLDLADEVILLPIYPAREKPIEGVTSELILAKMHNPHKQILSKEQLLQWIRDALKKAQPSIEVFITAGAGDIDTLVAPVKDILTLKQRANNYAGD